MGQGTASSLRDNGPESLTLIPRDRPLLLQLLLDTTAYKR